MPKLINLARLNTDYLALKYQRKCESGQKTPSDDLWGPISHDPKGFNSKFQRFWGSTKVPIKTKQKLENRFSKSVPLRVDLYRISLLIILALIILRDLANSLRFLRPFFSVEIVNNYVIFDRTRILFTSPFWGRRKRKEFCNVSYTLFTPKLA